MFTFLKAAGHPCHWQQRVFYVPNKSHSSVRMTVDVFSLLTNIGTLTHGSCGLRIVKFELMAF